MNKKNNRFNENENENDNLILNDKIKKAYIFNKLIKTNLIKNLFLFRFILIIFSISLIIFILKSPKEHIYRNELEEIINKKIKLIKKNFDENLEKIISNYRKEVILDNKINEQEYEDNTDFSEYSPDIKIIAIYIPTFYYENEDNKFLNEKNLMWKNVKEAKPLFNNHYQPRKPIKEEKYLGYYI